MAALVYTAFSKDVFDAFRADNREGPVQMLNLIRLRELARYEDGRVSTGHEAYAAYGRISQSVLAELGGKIIWRGQWELGLIGPAEERWDICFIAEYPSVSSFAGMFKNTVYREAMIHRQAAVHDSRLVRLQPREAGVNFHGEA